MPPYRQAFAQPGASNTMINWYRAAFRSTMRENLQTVLRLRNPFKLFPLPTISVPTLILWGEKDLFLTKQLAEKVSEICQNAAIHYFPDASHWLPSDQPEKVSRDILEFIR